MSLKTIFFFTAWDQKSSFCDPNSIFYCHGQLHHLWASSCFCQINLEKFAFKALRFSSHLGSS